MTALLDTHLLLWVTYEPRRLSKGALTVLDDRTVGLTFSTASIWEVALKYARGKADFQFEPTALRRELLRVGYREILISSAAVIESALLPPHHRDLFDRMLVAQAQSEGLTLLTADKTLAKYAGVRRV